MFHDILVERESKTRLLKTASNTISILRGYQSPWRGVNGTKDARPTCKGLDNVC